MTEISYYDESITNDLTLLGTQVNAAQDLQGQERENAIKDMIKFKQGIRNRLLQFKSEVKNCKDPVQKGVFEKRLAEHEAKHKEMDAAIQDVKKPKPKVTFTPAEPTDAGDVSNVTSARALLERGTDIQQDALRSIQRSQRMIANAEDTAIATENELMRQRDTLQEIDKSLDELESNTKRAGREIRWFARNLQQDKFFMCIFVLVVCALVTIIAYKIYQSQKSGGGAPVTTAVPGPIAPSNTIDPLQGANPLPPPVPVTPAPTPPPAPPTVAPTPAPSTLAPTTAPTLPPLITASGYLVDFACINAKGSIALDGSNVSSAPQFHTVKCALMPQCIASGYAILSNVAPAGAPKVFKVLYTLDAASNAKAVTYLQSLEQTRNNVFVVVRGTTKQGNFTIVDDFVDAAQGVNATESSVTASGYLVDFACINAPGSIALDGSNVSSNPELHTVKCALMPPCIASGYAILTNVAPEGAPKVFKVLYALDAASNTKAQLFLQSLDPSRNNILVVVSGTVHKDSGNMTVTGNFIDAAKQSVATPSPTPMTTNATNSNVTNSNVTNSNVTNSNATNGPTSLNTTNLNATASPGNATANSTTSPTSSNVTAVPSPAPSPLNNGTNTTTSNVTQSPTPTATTVNVTSTPNANSTSTSTPIPSTNTTNGTNATISPSVAP
jgi:very-short-patch-repair endonuclease